MDDLWTWTKLVATGALAALIELLDYDPKLIVLVCVLVLLDLTTGIYASIKRGDPITARRLRSTITKTLQYIAILLTFSIIAAAFEVLTWMREAAFAYVALIESKSITENVYGDTEFWTGVMNMKNLLRREADSELHDPDAVEPDLAELPDEDDDA